MKLLQTDSRDMLIVSGKPSYDSDVLQLFPNRNPCIVVELRRIDLTGNPDKRILQPVNDRSEPVHRIITTDSFENSDKQGNRQILKYRSIKRRCIRVI